MCIGDIPGIEEDTQSSVMSCQNTSDVPELTKRSTHDGFAVDDLGSLPYGRSRSVLCFLSADWRCLHWPVTQVVAGDFGQIHSNLGHRRPSLHSFHLTVHHCSYPLPLNYA